MTWLNEVYYDTDSNLCHSTLHLAKSSELAPSMTYSLFLRTYSISKYYPFEAKS